MIGYTICLHFQRVILVLYPNHNFIHNFHTWQAISPPWVHQHNTVLKPLVIPNFNYKSNCNFTPLIFFSLPKPICEKAWVPKQIAATGVLEWRCKKGKLTMENTIPHQKIKIQPWETLPLCRKTKTHCSLNPQKPSFASDLQLLEY